MEIVLDEIWARRAMRSANHESVALRFFAL